jgi:putative MATE family efflux protein
VPASPPSQQSAAPASTHRQILALAVPAFLALVAEPLFLLGDSAIIGHLGTDQLAGLGVASAALLTAANLYVFLAYGTTALVARRLGAGQDSAADGAGVDGIWLSLLLGAVTTVVVAIFAGPICDVFGASAAVADEATTYLRISAFGIPGMLAVLAATGVLRGFQDTRTPLAVALGTSALNLVLEVVLIYRFGFGLGASALATVVAQWLGAFVYVLRIVRAVRRHGVRIGPRSTAMRALLLVGVHLLVRTAALRGSLLLGTAAAARLGRDELAAYQVGFEVWSFLALALDALAIAAQALVGRALGAGDAGEARAVGRRVNQWGVLTGAVLGLLVLALRGPLAALFSGDAAVVELAAWSLVWVAATQPVNGWVFALDGILIGAGDQRYLAWAMTAAFVAFAPIAWWVASSRPGLGWLWAALIWLMIGRLVALQVRFRGGRWAVVGATRPA